MCLPYLCSLAEAFFVSLSLLQLQQQQNRLIKINHDLRHRITVVEAQGKALIEQKVELEAYLQTKEQEMGALRAELGKLREKLQAEHSQNGDESKVGEGAWLSGGGKKKGFSTPTPKIERSYT